MQIGCTELPLASFLFVLSLYGESLGGHGFAVVLSTIALQASLDSVREELELTWWLHIDTGLRRFRLLATVTDINYF